MAVAAQPTDPESPLFPVGRLAAPLGPCLETSADGNSATSQVTFDETQEGCWPGGGYCSDGATTWTLERVKVNGKPSLQLSINKRVSTYQDTNGWKDEEKWRVVYELVEGCALGLQATSVASRSCLSCNTPYKLQDPASSTKCITCPSGTYKQLQPSATTAAAPTPWYCIPNMQKGFETIAVRREPGGDPSCASLDGKKCLRELKNGAKTCGEIVKVLNANPPKPEVVGGSLKPLVCGVSHQAAWGITGYTTPGHWCVVSREWFQDNQPSAPGKCVA